MADDQEKTEDPTPKKLEDARERGDVPQSKEFATFIVFAGLCLAVYFGGDLLLKTVLLSFEKSFLLQENQIETSSEFILFGREALISLMIGLAPIFGAVTLFGLLAYVGQFGFLFTGKKLLPNFEKINPISGFKRIFSKDTLVELIKSIMKVSIVTAIMYSVLKSEISRISVIGLETVGEIFVYMMTLSMKLMLGVLLFMAVLGFLDFLYQRWSFHQKQKMSVKEVKDEYKQREGDPMVKARVRQIQRELARSRMMNDVPTADVVVANPTHVAVAIKYTRGKMAAPTVVAKGAGHIAVKIKEMAIRNGVPVLEKRSLARFLFRNVDIGQAVPESLYSAVAEVLAYVYKMKAKYKSLGGLPSELKGQEAQL
jgi:flagellar biosynthetic protein FlhB